MKTRFHILLAAAVLASITCQTLSPGTSPQSDPVTLDPILFGEAESQLREIVEKESEMGQLFEIDTNQDGRADELMYRFPQKEIEADVILETNLIHSPSGAPQPGVSYYLLLTLSNLSAQEKHIQFTYEIPKDFAQSVDDLTFAPYPDQIIDPDPFVLYDIMLPPLVLTQVMLSIGLDINVPLGDYIDARLKLRQDALNRVREDCKLAPVDDKSICYLSLVADFQDMLDKKEMEAICVGEVIGLERRICLSIARDNPAECDRAAAPPEDVMVCRGFYVTQKCRGLDDGELQACLRDQSIANNAPAGCLNLEDPDVRNDCVARASNDAAFCRNITNQARRAACLAALNAGGDQAQQPGEGSGSTDPSKWFNDADSGEECKAFFNLFPEYKVNRTSGGYFDDVATLSCSMDANDPELDDILTEVNIWVYGYNSPDLVRQTWDDETMPYSYASFKKQQETNTDPDITFTLEGDRYISVHKKTGLDNTVVYSTTAGSLYQNARIAFRWDSFAASDARWQQVEEAFKQLIDRKLQQD